MTPQRATEDETFLSRVVEATVRIGLLFALAAWCFAILRPFVLPIAWAVIIAVAIHPLYVQLRAALGERPHLAAAIVGAAGVLALLLPMLLLGGTLVEGAQALSAALKSQSLRIPPPPDAVRDWPVIGRSLHAFWSESSSNLAGVLQTIRPQLLGLGRWLLGTAAGAGFAFLQTLLAIVIAAVLLPHDARGQRTARALSTRLAGDRGAQFADLATATVRSVAQGILGVALIQSFLAGVGFLAVGLPGAGLLTLLCLFLCVVQIGPTPITLPAIVYVWVTHETAPAALFTAWSLLVSFVDNLVKPMLLGRGLKVPVVVIFLGSIGGFLWAGIIGLFVGAVVLVFGYTILQAWLGEPAEPSEAAVETPDA